MEWIIVARCDECNQEETFEVESITVPYSVGDSIDFCKCGGKFIVEEILEVG